MDIFPKISFMQECADLGVEETDFVAPTFQAVCVVPIKLALKIITFFLALNIKCPRSLMG